MVKRSLPLLLILTQACNCDDPFLQEEPKPDIEVSDSAGHVAGDPVLVIDFGVVEVNGYSARKVLVKNTGDAPLVIKKLGPVVDAVDSHCPNASAEFTYRTVSSGREVEVAKGGEHTVEITYHPLDGGPDCAILEVQSNDPDEAKVRVYLKASGAAAKFCAAEATLDFGDVTVGERRTLTTQVGNCGTLPATLVEVRATSSFPPFEVVTPVTTPQALLPGQMFDVVLAFAPTEPVRYGGGGMARDPGVLLFALDDGETAGLTLLGRGVLPPACRLLVAPMAINFGAVAVGASATRQVILSNSGDAECTVQGVARTAGSADFTAALSSTPLTVAPSSTTTFDIQFAPAAAGLQNATFHVSSNTADTANQDVNVEANQPPPQGCFLAADPSFLNFGIVPTGSTSSRVVKLKNIGTEDCSVQAVTFPVGGGEFSSSITITPFIGLMITTGSSFDLNVNFRSTTPGPRTGRAHVTYKDGDFGSGNTRTLDVDLAATAEAPAVCVVPSPLDFGAVPVGAEVTQTVEISSCGASQLNVRGMHLASGTSPAFDIPTLPTPLPRVLEPGLVMGVTVRYRPTAVGGDLGVLIVNSDDPDQPAAQVRLLGNAEGLCPPLMRCTPTNLSFGNVEVGIPQTRSVVCRNYGTQTVTVTSATVTPAPPFAATALLPATLNAGDAMTVQVTVAADRVGAMTGTLTVHSNACQAVQNIQIEATGVPPVIPECSPPNSFSPREQWAWTNSLHHPQKDQVWMTPLVINLNDDNNDGVVSALDIPDVVFASFDGRDFNANPQDADNFNKPIAAVVRALSGDDGRELWTVQADTQFVQSEAGLAAGDIDGDGYPEIIGSKFVVLPGEAQFEGGPKVMGRFIRGNLLCFNHDGTFRWESEEWTGPKEEMEDGGAPALADLDQDGFAEIIYRNSVFDHEGHLKWRGDKGAGSAYHGAMPVAVDLDGDGRLEVLAGKTAYRADGTVLWNRDDVGDGLTAVADFELDGKPEVLIHNGKLHILNGENGTDAYPDIALPYPDPSCTGTSSEHPECDTPIPTNVALADFDGDGKPEIAVANKDFLLVLEVTGQEHWRTTISDQTGASGPAAFDFEGDGIFEVVYADEGSAFALRGSDGTNIYTAPRSSRTIFEYPAIADVDNDGHANMVVVENEPLARSAKGVKMLTNNDGQWSAAGRVWNQHAFHITNITENGAIPRQERPHWAGGARLNSFRAQVGRCE